MQVTKVFAREKEMRPTEQATPTRLAAYEAGPMKWTGVTDLAGAVVVVRLTCSSADIAAEATVEETMKVTVVSAVAEEVELAVMLVGAGTMVPRMAPMDSAMPQCARYSVFV